MGDVVLPEEYPESMAKSPDVLSFYGGPYDKSTWEPEPIQTSLSGDFTNTWELSVIIYDVFFIVLMAALLLGQLTLLYRGACHLYEYLTNRFFLGQKLADFKVEDWNKVHILRYTNNQVDYVGGDTDEYEFHTEDYQELARVLNFVDEHCGA
ncbi:unnamed protein product [Calicophoron daubneyi]|uniref:Autophagy-related protein 9 n=1 Tax=Calicophoron daubneyi TaxID=300641 RepID=A0AAV2T624_CALDB